MMSNKEIFNEIYNSNAWSIDSGTGSLPQNAQPYIEYVNGFIKAYKIKTILDLGSGDTKILRSLNISTVDSYTCIEVSDIAIKRYYKNLPSNVQVINEDITNYEYPNVDLIIIKDVLQHLDIDAIKIVMDKIIKSCRYAIITNDLLSSLQNININNGEYRGINLQIDPFNYDNLQIVKTYRSFQEEKVVSLYRNPNETL